MKILMKWGLILIVITILLLYNPFAYAQTQQQPTEPLITINAKDINIVDAIKLIAEKSKISVITGKEIQGKTSFFLENISPKNALIALSEANNLSCTFFHDNIILINSNETEIFRKNINNQKNITTSILPVKNIPFSTFKNLMVKIKNSDIRISHLPGTKSLLLEGDINTVHQLQSTIESIDKNLETKTYHVEYAPIEPLRDTLYKYLTEGLESIYINKHSNSLIISALPDTHKKMNNIIKKLDTRPLQVNIEAKIVQVILSDENLTGINWEAIINRSKEFTFNAALSTQPENKNSQLKIASVSSNSQVEAIMNLLKSQGEIKLLSQPTLTVLNNEKAKILVGENRAYITTTTTLPASGISNSTEQVNFIEIGVKLFVTPQITRKNTIKMHIKPEVSAVAEILTTSSGNAIPIIQTSQAETAIIAHHNETIVIGGLIKNEEMELIDSVPLVGKIPILGHLFKNTEKTSKKTELVIFITAKVKN